MSAVSKTFAKEQGLSGESLNRWTHALGFVLSVPAACVLWRATEGQDLSVTLAFGIYCLALVLLYAASALSHSFEARPKLRRIFRTADQICIHLMIAGSFTPFAAMYLRTPWGIAQVASMWVLAAWGIALRIRERGNYIGKADIALCLTAGWIPALSVAKFYTVGGAPGFCLVFAGAAFYMGGIYFLLNDHRHPYWHGVWHTAALGGTACHYLFLLDYVAEV